MENWRINGYVVGYIHQGGIIRIQREAVPQHRRDPSTGNLKYFG
jgi:hypothetical protein